MKLVKKMLFPILTCLTVICAAVLPPYISQIKDDRQFAQIHASELNADALPVWEGRDRLERLELYFRWCTNIYEVIPSSQIPVEVGTAEVDLAEQAFNYLIQADVIPTNLLDEFPLVLTHMDRILIWDPSDGTGGQEPTEFWKVAADLGEGFLNMVVDGESGLPLTFNLFDPDMIHWMLYLYNDPETLANLLAERFFDLWNLQAELVEIVIPSDATDVTSWEWRFVIEGTDIVYWLTFANMILNIHMSLK